MSAEPAPTPPATAGPHELEASELRVDSHAVSVWRSGRGPVLLTLALALASIGAGVSAFLALVLWLAADWARRRWQAHAARARPAVVRVRPGAGGGLVVEREGKHIGFALKEIADCWYWPDSRGVNVVVATRRSLVSIQVQDRASAAALSRALGVDTSRQLVGTSLTAAPVSTERPWQRLARRYLAVVVVMGSMMALFFSFSLASAGVAPMLLMLVFMAALALPAVLGVTRRALPSRVLVGRDGVLLSSLGRREFVGYDRIKHVRVAPFATALTLTNDEIVLLPMSPIRGARKHMLVNPIDAWTHDPQKVRARRNALAEQIDTALTRFRNAGAELAAAGRLVERGPRSIAEWRDAITRSASPGYREIHVDAGTLLDIVENPRSPVDQRLGAALALAHLPGAKASQLGGDGDHEQRLRDAIASSANPRVRIALERATEGTLDDATYDRAAEVESIANHSSHAGLGAGTGRKRKRYLR